MAAQGSAVRNLVVGFIAAAIAVVTIHQLTVLGLTQAGLIKGEAWSMKPVPPYAIPAIANNIFWGGLWGALFGLVWDKLPGGAMWLRGLIYGLCVVVVSNWIFLPLIKGKIFGIANQPLFAGGDPKRLLAGAIILGLFGAATAVFYAMMSRR